MAAPLNDLELLRRLVAFPSVSRESNEPIADFLCEYLNAPDVRIERDASPGEGKVNLIISKGPAADDGGGLTNGLCLSGHMDVVPADEPGWTSPPFELTERNGDLVARGSADMKGSVALAANLFRETDASDLCAPLALLLTCDEELGSLGAQAFARRQREMPAPLPRSVIVGEPTEMSVVRMHKGHLKMRIVTEGVSAHSGYPHLGANAIEPIGGILARLGEYRLDLESRALDSARHFPQSPRPTLNLARIRGGDALNIIPDRCELAFGVRLMPGMDSAEIINEITALVREAAAAAIVEVINDSPPMLTDEDAPVARALSEIVNQHETASLSLASDAGPLRRLGFECVLFGPGSIEVAHKPDEFLPRREFEAARPILGEMISRFCLLEQTAR